MKLGKLILLLDDDMSICIRKFEPDDFCVLIFKKGFISSLLLTHFLLHLNNA